MEEHHVLIKVKNIETERPFLSFEADCQEMLAWVLRIRVKHPFYPAMAAAVSWNQEPIAM